MKLTAMSQEVFDYVKSNGGRVSIEELANATGRSTRSVGANVTDLTKKGLAGRVKEKGADDKDVTYVQLTDEGFNFVPSED
jgi:uncharacterized membrane protein